MLCVGYIKPSGANGMSSSKSIGWLCCGAECCGCPHPCVCCGVDCCCWRGRLWLSCWRGGKSISSTIRVGVWRLLPLLSVHSSMTNLPSTVTYIPFLRYCGKVSAFEPNMRQINQDVFSWSPYPCFTGKEKEAVSFPFGVLRVSQSLPRLPLAMNLLIVILTPIDRRI